MLIGPPITGLDDILSEIDGYLGFALVTRDGVPRVIDIGKNLNSKDETLLATLCAAISGGAKVICKIINDEESSCPLLSITLSDVGMYLIECKNVDYIVCLILRSDVGAKEGATHLKRLAEFIDQSGRLF